MKNQTKICAICKVPRSIKDFGFTNSQQRAIKGRRKKQCRLCRNRILREKRKRWSEEKLITNKAKRKIERDTYHRDDPEKKMFMAARKRARKLEIDFNIEISDIIIPKKCPILGTELREITNQVPPKHKPSLDRINPKKGYIKGNIAVTSYRGNMLKNNITLKQAKRIVKYLKAHGIKQ